MKRIYVFGISCTLLLAGACNDSNGEKDSTPAATQSSSPKEESKTSISISKDSVGITTKKGDKVEVNKDGGSMENKDAKVDVKKGG